MLPPSVSMEKLKSNNGYGNTNNSTVKRTGKTEAEDTKSLTTSEDSYQENGRYGCCNIFSVLPWKRLTNPRCSRPKNSKDSYYRKFSTDQEIPNAEFLEPVEEASGGVKESPLHGKDGYLRTHQNFDQSVTRTPYTSNRSRQNENK